ncbi:hypothetical protein V6N13_028380 [Hibiscus sabdariffa]
MASRRASFKDLSPFSPETLLPEIDGFLSRKSVDFAYEHKTFPIFPVKCGLKTEVVPKNGQLSRFFLFDPDLSVLPFLVFLLSTSLGLFVVPRSPTPEISRPCSFLRTMLDSSLSETAKIGTS